jgi:lycopene beta-cyclase
VRPDGVRLASGEIVPGRLVVDGRGRADTRHFAVRWQKFLGLELDLHRPHGLDAPVLMDATVEQLDGYRFLYVLPLAPRRVLVEDTCYSDGPELAVEALRDRVLDYARSQDFAVAGVAREEAGVLPIVLGGDVRAFWSAAAGDAPRSGMSAMLCHHTTGYTLPEAVQVAERVAVAPQLESASVARTLRDYALVRWREQRLFRLLNRLMFEAAEPGMRWRTLQHFYRLPEPVIARFYAGRPSATDALRVLSGRPPVRLGPALRCIARGLLPGAPRPRAARGGAA